MHQEPYLLIEARIFALKIIIYSSSKSDTKLLNLFIEYQTPKSNYLSAELLVIEHAALVI